MFSCEYCEIFKNSYFHRTPPVAASENPDLPKPIASVIIFQAVRFIMDLVNGPGTSIIRSVASSFL